MLQVRGRSAAGRWTAHAVKGWGAAALLVAATALAACGSSGSGTSTGGSTQAQGQGPSGGTIVWAKPAEVTELDPTTAINATATEVLSNVYEGLVGLDENARPAPKLATSWQQTSPTTYVFDIRRGVKFSNGRAMTVDDVVGSLKRLTDPKTAANWAPQVGRVRSITAKGDSQVEVVLAEPNAAFIVALAHVPAAILPMKELKAGTFDPRRELLGTGPYKVASHTQDEAWNLVRNPYYWDKGLPKADKLTVRIMKDDSARVAGLRDGSVDVASFDTPDTVKLLAGQADVKTAVPPTTEFYRLDLNSISSIFRDPRLRQAVSLTLDRNEIASVALAGTGEPTAAVAPGFGICKPEDMPYGTQNIAQAKQLVEQAGAKGKTVTLLAPSSYPQLGQIAQVVQPKLEAAGFNVKIEQPEAGDWIKRAYSGRADFDMTISWFGSLADPAMGLTWWGPEQGWHTAWIPDDKTLDDLIDRSHTVPVGPARDATIKAACRRIAENASIIPLVTKPVVVAYRADKVNPVLPKLEPYFNPLRNIPEFTVNGG